MKKKQAASKQFHCQSEHETLNLAKDLAKCIAQQEQIGLIIFLNGDLGAGKTTFTRGVLKALGHEGIVKSPTYTLVEPYEDLGTPVYHFDCYRIEGEDEWAHLGFEDYFQPGKLCIIEWPEKLGNHITADLIIDIKTTEALNARKLCFTANSSLATVILKQL